MGGGFFLSHRGVSLGLPSQPEPGKPTDLTLCPFAARLGDWAMESSFVSSLSDLPKGVTLSPPLLRQGAPYGMRGREQERLEHVRMDSSEERESPPPHKDWGLQPGRQQGLAKWLEEADSSFFGQMQVGGGGEGLQAPSLFILQACPTSQFCRSTIEESPVAGRFGAECTVQFFTSVETERALVFRKTGHGR